MLEKTHEGFAIGIDHKDHADVDGFNNKGIELVRKVLHAYGLDCYVIAALNHRESHLPGDYASAIVIQGCGHTSKILVSGILESLMQETIRQGEEVSKDD